MKTQDLLLLAIGVGVGYYGFKRYQQTKPKVATPAPAPESVQKTCEEQWTEKAKTLKLTGDALATAKTNFIISCSPVMTATI